MELMTLNAGKPLTMSSREIAELCDKQHGHVMRDIRVMFTELKIEPGEAGSKFGASYQDSTGRTLPCFSLDKELTMTLVAGYNTVLRNRIIKRWMELEAKATAPRELTRMELIQLAMQAEQDRIHEQEKRILLEHKVAEQAPKVQFHDDVGSAINCQTFDEVAKELGTGRIRLCRWLREQGYLMGDNVPYQRYIDMGLFKMIAKTRPDRRSGELISYNKTLITGKGLTHIHKRIKGLPVDLPANDHHAEVSA